MQFGVLIEQGPQNWQIYQQQNGAADIFVAGRWNAPESVAEDQFRIFVRIVEEATGTEVIPWTPAQMEENRFEITLRGVPAGGPYRLESCMPRSGNGYSFHWAVRGDIRHHIGVGDLYVIAGQSNAKGYGREPVEDSPQLGVHMLRPSGRWELAAHPLGDATDILPELECTIDRAITGVSPYLQFAKQLRQKTGWPVGLLPAALGGSPISRWNPETGDLYAAMLKIIALAGGKLRGMLWFQGCSDCTGELSPHYQERFRAMVEHFRQKMGEPLPIITCQLNRQVEKNAPEDPAGSYFSWTRVRQAQLNAADELPGVFVVPTAGLPFSDGIHISSHGCMQLGGWLARAAWEGVYLGKKWSAPRLVSARKTAPRELTLTFAPVSGGLFCNTLILEKYPVTVWENRVSLPVTGCILRENQAVITVGRDFAPACTTVSHYEGVFPDAAPFSDLSGIPCLAVSGVPVTEG